MSVSSSTDLRSATVSDHESPRGEPQLSDRTIRSSAWLFLIRAAVRGCLMLQVVVLVRFLSPEQFGVVGLALLSLSMLRTFTEGGMELALIQRPGDIRGHLNTAWVVQVIRGMIIASALFLFAPQYCGFFNEPGATTFIQSFGLPMLILGFANIGIVEYKKQVQFEKLVSFEVVPAVLNFVVTIGIAYQYQTVWAILFGRVAESIAKVIISYRVHTFRPRLRFDRQHFRDLFGFGKWIYLSTILLFLLNHGDNIVVGRVLGTLSLGYYQFGFRIAKLPVTEINATLSKVLFPAFSRIQNDTERLKAAYFKSVTVVLTITIPLAFGIFVIAPYAIPAVLGQEWLPSVPLVQVFSILGLLVSIGSTTGNVFKAIGKPSISTMAQFCRAVIMFSAMLPMIEWKGAVGAAYAVVLSELAIGGFLLLKISSLLGAGIADYARAISCQLIAACGMVAAVHFAAGQLSSPDSITNVLALVTLGALVYGLLIALLDSILRLNLLKTFTNILSRFRK